MYNFLILHFCLVTGGWVKQIHNPFIMFHVACFGKHSVFALLFILLHHPSHHNLAAGYSSYSNGLTLASI